jgi:hypothetical protein
MRAEEKKLTENLQDALSKGVLKRLPLTFLPFINQQLNQWNYLFPNERQSVERLLLFVANLTPEQSDALFHDTVELEEKMGVRHWEFSTAEQTILNSSQLARSPYFQEWRRAVQAVFDAADQHALKANGSAVKPEKRLVLLDIPQSLPADPATIWRRWLSIGKPISLDLALAGDPRSPMEFLLAGAIGGHTGGVLDAARRRSGTSTADAWVVDAGKSLTATVLGRDASVMASPGSIFLSYGRLDTYRESFSHEMNTMHKDLADADAVFDRLRKVDVTPWCPPEVVADPAIREFLRSLYLTGNGAVIFGNSFAQWAYSEAFRRARPSFLAAQFGMRSRPKPFTGVAVFDNPDQVNPLPAVDDPAGSAVDAQMLALYVWLAAYRYEEYQRSTVCICVAESISQAYVVAPTDFTLILGAEPVSLDRLRDALCTWIS